MEYIKIKYGDKLYPKRLLEIKDSPQILYAIGNVKLLEKKLTVGIIGSRNCTEYGRKYSTEFSKELAQKDICIISGMAKGIDAAAHIGAVEQKGRTIAVLGSGFEKIYPKENEWLFHKIVANSGLILSEYAPDVEGTSENFPKRNRIVSGLSDGILVVEAAYRSGTSITAAYAIEQGKKVFCMPSNLDSINGTGTNRLIQSGVKLIISTNDIMKELKKDKKSEIKDGAKQKKANNKAIPIEYKKIYEIIEKRNTNINDISIKLKKTTQEIAPILTMMELEGYIQQIAGNQFKIKED